MKSNRMDANEQLLESETISLVLETLTTLETYLDRIVAHIQQAAENYKNKSLITADTFFVKTIDGLDLFVQTIGGIKLALKTGLNPQLGLIEASLVSIMNDLLDAKRQNNYILLSELLQKELLENLSDWKTKVFPLLRSFKKQS